MPGELVSVQKAAEMLSVAPGTVRRWISDGKLKAYRIGGTTLRIDPNELMKMLEPTKAGESE